METQWARSVALMHWQKNVVFYAPPFRGDVGGAQQGQEGVAFVVFRDAECILGPPQHGVFIGQPCTGILKTLRANFLPEFHIADILAVFLVVVNRLLKTLRAFGKGLLHAHFFARQKGLHADKFIHICQIGIPPGNGSMLGSKAKFI